LGTADPEVCHIIPFAINSNLKNMRKIRKRMIAASLLAPDPQNRWALLAESLGGTDKAWNMLALNRQLHKWWAKCYFAFRCLGITPQSEGQSIIQLQFCWMKQQKPIKAKRKGKNQHDSNHWIREIDPDSDNNKKLVEDWKAQIHAGVPDACEAGVVWATDANSHQPLLSGHTLKIQMATEDALNMKAMIDLRWACIQMATMSGAAGWPDFWVEEDDDEAQGVFFHYIPKKPDPKSWREGYIPEESSDEEEEEEGEEEEKQEKKGGKEDEPYVLS
jgi:hypothetical protein